MKWDRDRGREFRSMQLECARMRDELDDTKNKNSEVEKGHAVFLTRIGTLEKTVQVILFTSKTN